MLRFFRFRMAVIALIAILLAAMNARGNGPGADPWTPAQLTSPKALNKRLAETKGVKPLIIHVGFRILYDQAYIPGSAYHGPGAKPEGLAELKKQVQRLPRNTEIVIYCGCCPWNECPNIRPAFQTLKEMRFTRIKVLSIPTSLAVDWAGKGYPLERGK